MLLIPGKFQYFSLNSGKASRRLAKNFTHCSIHDVVDVYCVSTATQLQPTAFQLRRRLQSPASGPTWAYTVAIHFPRHKLPRAIILRFHVPSTGRGNLTEGAGKSASSAAPSKRAAPKMAGLAASGSAAPAPSFWSSLATSRFTPVSTRQERPWYCIPGWCQDASAEALNLIDEMPQPIRWARRARGCHTCRFTGWLAKLCFARASVWSLWTFLAFLALDSLERKFITSSMLSFSPRVPYDAVFVQDNLRGALSWTC